jgi:CDP-diacylglycerol--glycerol-3-phosphate 3-phosphatidyltransferase
VGARDRADAPLPFIAVLIVAWLTDAVDGTIARRYHLESPFGAKLDSIADNSLSLSMIGYVYLLRRELYTSYWYLIAILVAVTVTSIALQARRRAPMHTYPNKATAWVLAVFLVYTFIAGVNPIVMWVTFALLGYATTEAILILLLCPTASEGTRCIWTAFRRSALIPAKEAEV